ncbi:hypothetical protein M0638_27685, partial [Roseomonas sp. NAR14]
QVAAATPTVMSDAPGGPPAGPVPRNAAPDPNAPPLSAGWDVSAGEPWTPQTNRSVIQTEAERNGATGLAPQSEMQSRIPAGMPPSGRPLPAMAQPNAGVSGQPPLGPSSPTRAPAVVFGPDQRPIPSQATLAQAGGMVSPGGAVPAAAAGRPPLLNPDQALLMQFAAGSGNIGTALSIANGAIDAQRQQTRPATAADLRDFGLPPAPPGQAWVIGPNRSPQLVGGVLPNYEFRAVGNRLVAFDPRDPTRRIDVGAAPDTRPTVTIDQRGATAFEQRYGTQQADRAVGIEQAGQRAGDTLRQVNLFESLNRRFDTGAGAGMRLTAQQLARQVPGMTPELLARFGIDPGETAAGEALRGLTSRMLTGLIGSGAFPTNNFSDADRQMLERALPSLGTTPEGNRVLLGVIRAGAQRDREIATAWRSWRRDHAGQNVSDAFESFQAERLPQITERDDIGDLLRPFVPQDAPAGAAGAAGAVGGGIPGPTPGSTASPPAPASAGPPRVTSPEEAMRLPSGTVFIDPNGQRRVRP